MKKIYYEIAYEYKDDDEYEYDEYDYDKPEEVCVTNCPYGMNRIFKKIQSIIKVGSYLCTDKCIHATGLYDDNLNYVYCDHPETYNRNKANK